MVAAMPRRSCQNPNNCHAAGRGGPCRTCDAEAIARRAVLLRERIMRTKRRGAHRMPSALHSLWNRT